MAGMTLLSQAASALKSAGSNVPLMNQIDSVSNALTGYKREREISNQGEGYPPEAKNVLEILKIQINKAVDSLSEQAVDEQKYNKLVEDLEIIEAFADRIIKFYEPKEQKLSEAEEELTTSLKHSFARAKSEVVTAVALENLFNKINGLESWYRNNPKLTTHEFKEKLEDLSTKVKKWEDELVPGDPLLRDSQTIAERIYKIKSKLHEAIEISEMPGHPGVIGEMGLNILRLASDMVQHAKSQFEIEQAVMMALEANRNLKRGGKQFQDRGIAFNLLIQQSIAMFVNRQIRIIEKELEAPLYYIPGDAKKNEDLAKRLLLQMERLITYFEFVYQWAGPHQEDLLERIALVYEKIVERAEKAKHYVIDEASKPGTSKELAVALADVAAKFRRAETIGKDKIDPAAIFHEKGGVKDEIRKLTEQLPDQASSFNAFIPNDKLGRLYCQFMVLKKSEGLDLEAQSKISSALNRIEMMAMKQNTQVDIFNEMLVRSEYLKDTIEQEVIRFLVLLGMEPAVTTPAKYTNYPNPSEYPFKGNQLAKVIRNNRIIGNFLEGRYGNLKNHEAFQKISKEFYDELDMFCSKVKIDLLKRLKLPLIKHPKIEEIETVLEFRIKSLPENVQVAVKNLLCRVEESEVYNSLSEEKKNEAKDFQILWLMLQYVKYPIRMHQIEKIEEMQRKELIAFSRELIEKAEKEFLQQTLQELREDLQIDEIQMPLTEEYIDKHGGDRFGRKVIKRFIQLKNPIMKSIEPFSHLLLKSCWEHKGIAELIINPLVTSNPKLLLKLIVDTSSDVVKDAERVKFSLPTAEISALNQENQFYRDHQVSEVFPLYVEGLTELRKENENQHDRMLQLANNNEGLAVKIMTFATQSMFSAAMNKIKGMMEAFTGVPGLPDLEFKTEDLTQFLSFQHEKGQATIKGLAMLALFGPVPETGLKEEICEVTMKVEVEVQSDWVSDAKVSFSIKPYNAAIGDIREGKVWNLF